VCVYGCVCVSVYVVYVCVCVCVCVCRMRMHVRPNLSTAYGVCMCVYDVNTACGNETVRV